MNGTARLPRLVAGSVVLGAVFALSACGGGPGDRAADDGRVRVVASVEPLAELAAAVGGARAQVENLTPAGSEPHDLELSPGQVADLAQADLVVVLGGGFQPAVEQAVDGRDGLTLAALDTPGVGEGPAVDPEAAAHDHDHGDGDHGGTDGTLTDPHLWLDPVAMQSVVDAVRDAYIEIDPQGAAAYRRAADAQRQRFADLDEALRNGLARCERRTVVTAHAAFGWLARRYGLEQVAIAGISPEQEPSAQRLAELTDIVRREGVTTVFTEVLVSPAVARTLAAEAGGLRTDVLDPIETIAADARARGETTFTVARRNLDALRTALDCR